ncbi:bifunctional hydroxyacyl-CoA dehydrogenase/enoyl-CoA hydratase fox2 [Diaporthe australafricana]|uniref:Bifunctional hydroxyacyl-CoA dehydrogenase/enoyl-CoA hydratase fox2 n=1 Tax=Diaporthe australafricana TaxID=127596 RepID=A0ABR3XH04_9PEZI
MSSSKQIRFENRVAIVSGSGRGLGRQHALLLGRLGASVVVNSTTASTSQGTVDDIVKAGGKAIAYVGSVADPTHAEAMVKKAIDTFGRIDIIVNNAGTFGPKPFEQTTVAELRDMLAVHVEGSYNLTHAAWPHMQKQKYGRVVMITSHSVFGMAGSSTYAAAKLAVVGLAKTLAVEGQPHGILVNAVGTTGFTDTVAKTPGIDKGVQEFMKANLPDSEPARLVVWLTHEDSKVTGEVLGAQGRVASRVFLAETKGFQGSREGAWDVETIRDNWDQVVDEKDHVVHTDGSQIGPILFGRLSS